jgi:hypothetical protein
MGNLIQPRSGTPGPARPGNPVRVVFVLDTPNVWQGTAIAGTPARILELAGALERRGVRVRVVLCDRGMTEAESTAWALPGVLVHPSVYYGPPSGLAAVLEGFAPDLLVVTDAERSPRAGGNWRPGQAPGWSMRPTMMRRRCRRRSASRRQSRPGGGAGRRRPWYPPTLSPP